MVREAIDLVRGIEGGDLASNRLPGAFGPEVLQSDLVEVCELARTELLEPLCVESAPGDRGIPGEAITI